MSDPITVTRQAVNITISGAQGPPGGLGAGGEITVQEEGTPLATAATTLNFVGAGITASGAGATKTITLNSPASNPAGITGADAVTNIVSLTQAEYDAIVSPSATTVYVITDAPPPAGTGDALVADTLDQFADVTQSVGATLAITSSTTLSGGTHSGTNTGDQDLSGYSLTSHVHGNITAAGAIGSTANLPLITTTSGVITVGAFGTGATDFAAGNHTHAQLHDAVTLNANLTDVFSLSTQELSADDAGADKAVVWDNFNNKLTYATLPADITFGSGALTLNVDTAASNNTIVKRDGSGVVAATGYTGTWNGDVISVAKGGTGLTTLGSALQVLRVNAGATKLEYADPASGGGVTVQEEGTPLSTVADTLNFVGASLTASGTGTTKTITGPDQALDVASTVTHAKIRAVGTNGTPSFASSTSTTTGIEFPQNGQVSAYASGARVALFKTTGIDYKSTNIVGWCSGNAYDTNIDSGMARNAAGAIEINSGTAGTFRDLKLRNLTATGGMIPAAFTVATLPTTAATGMVTGAIVMVSDADTPVIGSAVASGAGTDKLVTCQYNGTNWIVIAILT